LAFAHLAADAHDEFDSFSQENDGELHYLLEFDPSSAEVNRSSAVSLA
jgi:hypothetical protein